MSKTTIEWTDDTWNPTRGCSRVSPGCVNCFAERIAARFSKSAKTSTQKKPKRDGEFEGFAIMKDSGPRWTGKVELIERKLTEPLHWKKSRRVFVNSMSDLFHEALSDDAIDRVFAVMALCPHITFQVLTKRPARMLEWANRLKKIGDEWAPKTVRKIFTPADVLNLRWMQHTFGGGPAFPNTAWPLPNIWFGVSVENQEYADERIPLLLKTPAAIRFVSYEPALGPVNFSEYLRRTPRCPTPACMALDECACLTRVGLDWIIAGGESGPGARPPHPDWFRDSRDQCQAAGVPFFFKQWGAWREPFAGEPYTTLHGRAGKPPAFIVQYDGRVECFQNSNHDRPIVMIMRGNGSGGAGLKNGGFLDGREWKEFPKPSSPFPALPAHRS